MNDDDWIDHLKQAAARAELEIVDPFYTNERIADLEKIETLRACTHYLTELEAAPIETFEQRCYAFIDNSFRSLTREEIADCIRRAIGKCRRDAQKLLDTAEQLDRLEKKPEQAK